ncbi:MAG: hypothetical protein KF726_28460 [Anaerolineae bacterium]|nr:hypothetical protein [Anaerolineae bacterium]
MSSERGYAPLTTYLQQETTNDVVLTFDVIERILGKELSPGAYEHVNWWDDMAPVVSDQARAWLDAGWHVDEVNLAGNWVKFRRD